MKGIINAIHRRLTGQPPAAPDRALVEAHPELTDDLTRIWNAAENYGAEQRIDTDAAWNRFSQRLAAESLGAAPAPRASRSAKVVALNARRPARRNWLRVAAAAVLFVAAGTFLWTTFDGGTTHFATLDGERTTVELPDGTTVELNGNSTLRYSGDFDRRVQLTGEAYFEVESDPANPFFIEAGEGEVQVLGTEFNLRAYPGEPCVEVHVNEGRVRFDCKLTGETLELTRDHRAALWMDDMKMNRRVDASANATAWKRGNLRFRKSDLETVFTDAGRFFGKQIDFSDARLGDCHLNGRYAADEWRTFCEALESNLGLTIEEKSDGRIKISGGHCK